MRIYLSLICLLWNTVISPCSFGQDTSTSLASDSLAKHQRLEFRKWSGDINVPDPVAVSVDPQGVVYATQTRRRGIQDLDIRSNSEWIPDDVGLQSIVQKSEFFKRVLAIGGDEKEQAKHLQDLNKDGVHDWRDLMIVSEVIYRLVDTDDDGLADAMNVFAEDFKTEVTGIAAGVLAYNGDVYATIAPDLWKLHDNDGDGIADRRESLAHGFGHHIAYGGHDMHGPTVGPDGKIYWSIGDKGINLTSKEGRHLAYPNQGGVMRCNPDGSDFEVFAHGLRNVQEVAFDQYGNLFGIDNDADMSGERERFVYIVDQMDAGWRCNYQYRGKDYNPWMAEHLWELPSEQHAAYIVPPISHYIDGPAGFKFNPGTAICDEYKNYFFATGAPKGDQRAFKVVPSGDSFQMVDDHQIGAGLAIVGLAFGPDGGLYGADWDGGYPMDEIGSIVRIDVPNGRQSPERSKVKQLLAAGFNHLSKSELLALLSYPDQRIRQGAQFALVALKAGDVLSGVAVSETADQLARLHAIWGLGQIARSDDANLSDAIASLMQSKDSIVRGQAAKTYGELKQVDGIVLIDLLDDEDLHVRTLAGLAIARQPTTQAVEPLLKQADALIAAQHYLRHSIVSALAACATADELAAQVQHSNELRRMCAVLALRRQADPAVAKFLQDPSDWVALEAARAIHDDNSIDEALPDLAVAVAQRASQPTAFAIRAINANFRLGDRESSLRLLHFVLEKQGDESLKLLALESLSQWHSPPVLDRVEGRRRELNTAARQVDTDAFSVGLAKLANAENEALRAATLVAARKLNVALPTETLLSFATNNNNASGTRIEALNSLAERFAAKNSEATLESFSKGLYRALVNGLESNSRVLQMRSVTLLGELYPESSLEVLASILVKDFSIPVKQTAIAAVAHLPNKAGRETVRSMADQLSAGTLDTALALEVREALNAFPEIAVANPLVTEKFAYSRDGGDAESGKQIFNNHVAAQCTRCHKTSRRGSEIGPELTKIASTRDADYLWRAIVQPSADIDAKYRMQMLLLSSGQVIQGLVQSKDEKQTIVADQTGTIIKIETDEIEEIREQSMSPMPDMSNDLTSREVRDLVAYLRSLR